MLLVLTILVLTKLVAAHYNPYYVEGHDTMVHLFEWKWTDIADECERFLGPMGFGGVQVSYIHYLFILFSYFYLNINKIHNGNFLTEC